MSVRYTGDTLATSPVIEDPVFRNAEHWKDKLDVRLDHRQVFFLFFGSAMVACLLFVLGVIVGKRLESRGHAEAPPIDDPLAILDRMASEGPVEAERAVTFPKALSAAPDLPMHARAPHPPAEPPRPELARASALEKAAAGPVAPAHATPLAKPAAALLPKPVGVPKVSAGAAAAAVTAASGRSQFTLQLSAFQDRADADAMVKKLGAEHAYVVATDIPGKGTWYRVRTGRFATFQEAAAAKSSFEREHNVIAYVAASSAPKD